MQSQPLMHALQRIFAPPYQDYMGLVVGHAGSNAVSASALFMHGRIDTFLALCASRFRGPDPRGVASYWAQRYVLALLPAALVTNLVLQRELPLELERTWVVIDDVSGLPQAICVEDEGSPRRGSNVFADTQTLVKMHLEPVAAVVAERVRMSPRVVTASAAFLAYQVLDLLALQGVADRNLCQPLFDQRRWGDGSANPFFHPLRNQAHGRPGVFKRVCCLSHTVAEVGRCGSCPLA